jgi:bifunctional aspartokinase / homoserine dehydrogenase 1
MKVLKFGGTSLKDARAIARVFDIVSKSDEKQIVVLSACSGITNILLELAEMAEYKPFEELLQLLDSINYFHLNLLTELIPTKNRPAIKSIKEVLIRLENRIEGISLLKECTEKSRNEVVAFGELLSTNLFYYYTLSKGLSTSLLDIREAIKIAPDGEVDFKSTDTKLLDTTGQLFKEADVIITQGFVAEDHKGNIANLGRGGSDYSAAIIGASLYASGVEIWTDVQGIMSANPALIDSARSILEMTFAEVEDLSFFGVKVLHPETIKPAIRKSIPVHVLNSYNPEVKGTVIRTEVAGEQTIIHSLHLIEDCIELEFNTTSQTEAFDVQCRLNEILNQNSIRLIYSEMIANRFNAIAGKENSRFLNEFIYEQKPNKQELSIIALCGVNLNTSGVYVIIDKITAILSKHNNARLLLGNSDNSILISCQKTDALELLRELHEKFNISSQSQA